LQNCFDRLKYYNESYASGAPDPPDSLQPVRMRAAFIQTPAKGMRYAPVTESGSNINCLTFRQYLRNSTKPACGQVVQMGHPEATTGSSLGLTRSPSSPYGAATRAGFSFFAAQCSPMPPKMNP
jgi:hypothetical protein